MAVSEEMSKVSVGAAKEHFDQQISERCARVREIALRVLNIESQSALLQEEKKSLLGESSALFAEIRKLADMAKTVLNLEGVWFCALDEGKLMPSTKAPTEPST